MMRRRGFDWKNSAVPHPEPLPPDDAELIEGLREGETSAVIAWIQRDHPIAELLCAVADAQPDSDRMELLATAWRTALGEVATAAVDPTLRPLLLREVLYALDDAGRLDSASGDGTPATPGPYLPDGDRWAGWWVEDDAVPPLAGRPHRAQVVAALRRLPLVSRVLLVGRDGGNLPLAQAATLVNGSPEQLDQPLAAARTRYIELVEELMEGPTDEPR
jgi:hypothetical protein